MTMNNLDLGAVKFNLGLGCCIFCATKYPKTQHPMNSNLDLSAITEFQRKFAEEQRQQAVLAKEEEEQQRQRAEEQANIALSRRLAEQAIQKLETDLELSILLALEAVKRANIEISSGGTIGIDEAKREAQHALHQAAHARRIRRTINGHTQAVNVVTYLSLIHI